MGFPKMAASVSLIPYNVLAEWTWLHIERWGLSPSAGVWVPCYLFVTLDCGSDAVLHVRLGHKEPPLPCWLEYLNHQVRKESDCGAAKLQRLQQVLWGVAERCSSYSVIHRVSEPSQADYSPSQHLTIVTGQNQVRSTQLSPFRFFVCFC